MAPVQHFDREAVDCFSVLLRLKSYGWHHHHRIAWISFSLPIWGGGGERERERDILLVISQQWLVWQTRETFLQTLQACGASEWGGGGPVNNVLVWRFVSIQSIGYFAQQHVRFPPSNSKPFSSWTKNHPMSQFSLQTDSTLNLTASWLLHVFGSFQNYYVPFGHLLWTFPA